MLSKPVSALSFSDLLNLRVLSLFLISMLSGPVSALSLFLISILSELVSVFFLLTSVSCDPVNYFSLNSTSSEFCALFLLYLTNVFGKLSL
jgi:hypothetical protein